MRLETDTGRVGRYLGRLLLGDLAVVTCNDPQLLRDAFADPTVKASTSLPYHNILQGQERLSTRRNAGPTEILTCILEWSIVVGDLLFPVLK
jgi:hypothetical protein